MFPLWLCYTSDKETLRTNSGDLIIHSFQTKASCQFFGQKAKGFRKEIKGDLSERTTMTIAFQAENHNTGSCRSSPITNSLKAER